MLMVLAISGFSFESYFEDKKFQIKNKVVGELVREVLNWNVEANSFPQESWNLKPHYPKELNDGLITEYHFERSFHHTTFIFADILFSEPFTAEGIIDGLAKRNGQDWELEVLNETDNEWDYRFHKETPEKNLVGRVIRINDSHFRLYEYRLPEGFNESWQDVLEHDLLPQSDCIENYLRPSDLLCGQERLKSWSLANSKQEDRSFLEDEEISNIQIPAEIKFEINPSYFIDSVDLVHEYSSAYEELEFIYYEEPIYYIDPPYYDPSVDLIYEEEPAFYEEFIYPEDVIYYEDPVYSDPCFNPIFYSSADPTCDVGVANEEDAEEEFECTCEDRHLR